MPGQRTLKRRSLQGRELNRGSVEGAHRGIVGYAVSVVDLRPFRCVNIACDGPGTLRRASEDDDLLVCETCGDRHGVHTYARAYGKATSHWVVFGAVLAGGGWNKESLWAQGALVLGALVGCLAIFRVIRQLQVLRGFKEP